MRELLDEIDQDYSLSPSASTFAALATDLEVLRGRSSVTETVRELLELPHPPEPTPTHKHAVRLFPEIITTNYDTLFERAAERQFLPKQVIAHEISEAIPEGVIIKMHGTCNVPESLVITESDVLMLDKQRPQLWSAVIDLLRVGRDLIDHDIRQRCKC